mmetsp:Transcript_4138/g.15441  ORF Transcript_4138/g.15441 Transcript_4138/m.15441 type:complete len:249 (+) Transcript_4138:116-862(+)
MPPSAGPRPPPSYSPPVRRRRPTAAAAGATSGVRAAGAAAGEVLRVLVFVRFVVVAHEVGRACGSHSRAVPLRVVVRAQLRISVGAPLKDLAIVAVARQFQGPCPPPAHAVLCLRVALGEGPQGVTAGSNAADVQLCGVAAGGDDGAQGFHLNAPGAGRFHHRRRRRLRLQSAGAAAVAVAVGRVRRLPDTKGANATAASSTTPCLRPMAPIALVTIVVLAATLGPVVPSLRKSVVGRGFGRTRVREF